MRDFASLFQGRDDVHGVYIVPAGTKPSTKGKLAGTASTKRDPVTADTYDAHLKGKRRLGIVPIRPGSNDVWWLALDVDTYKTPALHEELAKKIAKAKLPLVMTRSKSGGAHLWMFFREPINAVKARDLGAGIIKKLKLDEKTEVFPKQEMIREEDDGSWINLPYFGKTCLALGPDGITELSLTEFLSYANDRIQAPSDLKIEAERKPAERREIEREEPNDGEAIDGEDEMPPCIARMLREGVEEGGRDNALTHIGVYLARAYPDDWEERLAEINDEHFHPPLSTYDVGKVVKSLHKKNYQYLCKQTPMASFCNKELCLTRKFGVGGGEASSGPAILFDALEKLDGEEPIYRVTMRGRRFQVNGETLFRFSMFQIAAMKALDIVLPTRKQAQWMSEVQEQLAIMTVVKPPEDTQMKERVIAKFKEWCLQSAMQSTPSVITESGIPYFNGASLFFRGDDFMSMIDKQLRISRDQVWIYMRDWGVVFDEITVKDQKVKVWRYPVTKSGWFDLSTRDKI